MLFVPSTALSPLVVLGEPRLDARLLPLSLSNAFPAGKLRSVKQRGPISQWGNPVSVHMESATYRVVVGSAALCQDRKAAFSSVTWQCSLQAASLSPVWFGDHMLHFSPMLHCLHVGEVQPGVYCEVQLPFCYRECPLQPFLWCQMPLTHRRKASGYHSLQAEASS